MFELDEKILSWAQYLQWADINFNRFFCEDGHEPSTSIALGADLLMPRNSAINSMSKA